MKKLLNLWPMLAATAGVAILVVAPIIARSSDPAYKSSGFLFPLAFLSCLAAAPLALLGFAMTESIRSHSSWPALAVRTGLLTGFGAFLVWAGVGLAPMPVGPGSSTAAVAVLLVPAYAVVVGAVIGGVVWVLALLFVRA
jgi:hypothetical protein